MAKLQSPSRMKPGAGGGPVQNAKAQPKQRTNYLKSGYVKGPGPKKSGGKR